MKISFSVFLAAVMATLGSALPEAEAGSSHPPTCPVRQCDPNPRYNKCDITTSCIYTQPRSQLHCACRDGYKSSFPDDATKKHYRTKFVGQESRVFVAPGVKCDTLCDEWWLGPGACQEIPVVEACS